MLPNELGWTPHVFIEGACLLCNFKGQGVKYSEYGIKSLLTFIRKSFIVGYVGIALCLKKTAACECECVCEMCKGQMIKFFPLLSAS